MTSPIEVLEVVEVEIGRGRSAPPLATGVRAATTTLVVEVPPPSSTLELVMAPTLTTATRVNQVSIVVLLNAVVTHDVVLVEQIIEFTVQPCDRRERNGRQLAATITGVFPQLFTVSFFPFFCVSSTNTSVIAGGH